jgi:hypothetical protein
MMRVLLDNAHLVTDDEIDCIERWSPNLAGNVHKEMAQCGVRVRESVVQGREWCVLVKKETDNENKAATNEWIRIVMMTRRDVRSCNTYFETDQAAIEKMIRIAMQREKRLRNNNKKRTNGETVLTSDQR